MPLSRQGALLVVSGPSGVGKGTVINQVLSRQPQVRKSVSCTTRDPRPGERDGEDYYFISHEQFQAMEASSQLLESAVVHQELYGTPRGAVETALAAGQDIILEIDYQGAASVRRILGDRAVLIFVAPPSWQALVDRLRARNTESADAVARRVVSARVELSNIGMYEYLIVNEQVETSAAGLEAILEAERLRTTRQDWKTLQDALLSEAR